MIKKNTIKHLTKHKYNNENIFINYYNIKSTIFHEYTYILRKSYYIFFCRFKYDGNDNFYLVYQFEKDILSFFETKKEICKKEKEQRKKYRMIKPFVNHYKICHDIQFIIISFI